MYSNTILPVNGRYAMLLRKSREDIEAEKHGQFETLIWHEKALRNLAASYGITIREEDIYRELQSGDSLAERMETQRLLRKVAAGEYAGVLMNDIQRVSRGDMIDQGVVVSTFCCSSTLIITPSRIYDLADEYDTENVESDLMYGRRELKRIKKRLREGRERRAEDGQYLGSIAPFGWRKVVTENKKKTIEPNEDHDTLYDWYMAISTWETNPTAIANDLNRRGILSPRGLHWDKKTIVNIIRNEINLGYIIWNAKRTVEVMDANMTRSKKRIHNDNPIRVKGLHFGKSRITPELFAAANRQLDLHASSKEYGSRPLRNPLATILVCKGCHRAMYRTLAPVKGKGTKSVRLTHPRSNRLECFQQSAFLDDVIKLVISSLANAANDMEVSMSSNVDDREASIKSKIATFEQELAGAKKATDNLFRLAEKGLITDDEFGDRKRSIDERSSYARGQLEKAVEELASVPNYEELVMNVRNAISMLSDYEGREKDINDFLKGFIDRIEYEKDPETHELHLGVYFA